ncbi:hypothetical protein [Streptomyces hypolithicus]
MGIADQFKDKARHMAEQAKPAKPTKVNPRDEASERGRPARDRDMDRDADRDVMEGERGVTGREPNRA